MQLHVCLSRGVLLEYRVTYSPLQDGVSSSPAGCTSGKTTGGSGC